MQIKGIFFTGCVAYAAVNMHAYLHPFFFFTHHEMMSTGSKKNPLCFAYHTWKWYRAYSSKLKIMYKIYFLN